MEKNYQLRQYYIKFIAKEFKDSWLDEIEKCINSLATLEDPGKGLKYIARWFMDMGDNNFVQLDKMNTKNQLKRISF